MSRGLGGHHTIELQVHIVSKVLESCWGSPGSSVTWYPAARVPWVGVQWILSRILPITGDMSFYEEGLSS